MFEGSGLKALKGLIKRWIANAPARVCGAYIEE